MALRGERGVRVERMSKWAKVGIKKGDYIKVFKEKSVGFCKDVHKVTYGLAKGERGFKEY